MIVLCVSADIIKVTLLYIYFSSDAKKQTNQIKKGRVVTKTLKDLEKIVNGKY